MLQNYLRVMFRYFGKRKLYAAINLLGLAIGMAVCLLLVLYIQNEFGYDAFHEKGDRIYRLAVERKYPGRSAFLGSIPHSIGGVVQQEFPEVQESVRMEKVEKATLVIGDKTFDDAFFVVDSNFFRVFTADFLEGDKRTALQQQNTVVLSESEARRYFGSPAAAIGKTLKLNFNQDVTVAGVFRDWPVKAHFQPGILVSMLTYPYFKTPNYYDLVTYTYLLLKPNASPQALEAELPRMVEKYVAPTIEKGFGETYEKFTAEGNGYRYFLQPLTAIHLHSNLEDELRPTVSMSVIRIAVVIAGFILLLAGINFINLSTALSTERAREVGIRKTFGSARKALVGQFLSESVFFSGVSLVIALGLAAVALPLMNRITGGGLSMGWFFVPGRLLLLLVFALLLGLGAGLHPALLLSSFQPMQVLKGGLKSSRYGMLLRNGLVIFQFTISVVLIICTLVVNSQMQFALGDRLGFRKDHVIAVQQVFRLFGKSQETFFNEVAKIPGIEAVSRCSSLPNGQDMATCAMEDLDTRVSRTQKTIFVDAGYARLLGLQLTGGRWFSKDFPSDSTALVLNESAVADFGLKQPIGSRFTSTELFFNPQDGKSQTVYTVIGVIRDYHFQSLHRKIAPLVIGNAAHFGGGGLMAVRLRGDAFKSGVAAIGKLWGSLSPRFGFEYTFLDESLSRQYKAEQTAQHIFTTFSILAILIACIGLFGLATHSAFQRTKEVSIRKVIGASTGHIVYILSKDFLRLVLISSAMAFPLAGWAMYRWLQDFAYRVDIAWWFFAVAGGVALVIAFATISFQAIRLAMVNPVKGLRTE